MAAKRDRLREWVAGGDLKKLAFDSPALDRAAVVLLDALHAAGGEEANFEKYLATVKALAMIIGVVTWAEEEDKAKEMCDDLAVIVLEQVLSWRRVMRKSSVLRELSDVRK